MRTMYDAVTAANIPANAGMVAGYIDKIKLEPWSAADWARFPGAVKVTIVKKASTNAGHVLDVEPGDANPAEAPGWVQMRRAAGADPTVYMNASTWPAVRKAFQDAGVAEPHYWVARYDGDPTIPAGAVAKQYRGDVAPGIDISSVADYWPGVDDSNGGTLVATKEEIDAIAEATLNLLMSNQIGVQPLADGKPRFVPLSALMRYDDDHLTVIRAGVAQLLAQAGGGSADEVAAKLGPLLLPALTSALAAAVAGLDVSQLDKISDDDAQKIAQAVTDHAAALLKPTP